MSVSLSSVYEQTQTIKQIEQLFEKAVKQDSSAANTVIQQIINLSENLSMSEAYRMVAILSKNLSNKSPIKQKIMTLIVMKHLILTAFHHFYIFASVRVLGWLTNMAKFQMRKNQYERVKNYVKQLSIQGNGDAVVQQRNCYKLFRLVDQFLCWFAINLPTHINAQFQYSSTFQRFYEQNPNKKDIKSFQYFSKNDFNLFQNNFDQRKRLNLDHIKQLKQFVGLEVRSLLNENKHKSQLLTQLVKTADIYCIRAIVQQISQMLTDNFKLLNILKFTSILMNVGEVQFIELTKVQIVPVLVKYLFESQNKISREHQDSILESICVWKKITQKVSLSTEYYQAILSKYGKSYSSIPNISDKYITDFLTNVIDMQKVNNQKKAYIKQVLLQKQLIKMLQKDKKPLRASTINQLDQFNQSVISNKAKDNLQDSLVKAFNIPTAKFNNSESQSQQAILVGSIQKNLKKGVSLANSEPEQIVTFEKLPDPQNYSPIVNQIKAQKNNSQKSSFMVFETSNISKFSEYNTKKSKNDKVSPFEFSDKVQESQKIQSSSGSFVYFNRPDESSSQSTLRVKLNSSKSLSKMSFASQNSQKNRVNESQMSTYRFDSSQISRNSSNASSIKNFGQQDLFPESAPKQKFGFIKKQKIVLEEPESNQNIFLQQLSQKSQSSIKNLSKGAHELSQSVQKAASKSILSEGQLKISNKIKHHALQQPLQMVNFNEIAPSNYLNVPNQEYYLKVSNNSKKRSEKQIQNSERMSKKTLQFGENQNLRNSRNSRNSRQSDKGSRLKLSSNRKKHLIVDEFQNDKLISLQKQLGKALQEKNLKQQALKNKEAQYKILKSKSTPYLGRKLENLKKQNEIINILSNQKNKEEYNQNYYAIKPESNQAKANDYLLQNPVKNKVTFIVNSYDKTLTKQVLGARCLLIANQQLQLGYNYSQRSKQISLYLTFFKVYDFISLKIQENSLVLEKPLDINIQNQPAKSQLKIKRKVVGIRNTIEEQKKASFSQIFKQDANGFQFSQICLKIQNQAGQQKVYRHKIPCNIYSLSEQIKINSQIIEQLNGREIVKSQTLLLSPEFSKNFKQKFQNYFPNNERLSSGWNLIGFKLPPESQKKQQYQYFKVRSINGKMVQFQFFNNPFSLLSTTLMSLLVKGP